MSPLETIPSQGIDSSRSPLMCLPTGSLHVMNQTLLLQLLLRLLLLLLRRLLLLLLLLRLLLLLLLLLEKAVGCRREKKLLLKPLEAVARDHVAWSVGCGDRDRLGDRLPHVSGQLCLREC